MNTNWSKILVFGLLFGIAGYFIGRCCGSHCGSHEGCEKGMAGCERGGMMGHGGKEGACCRMEGHGEGHEMRVHGIVEGLKASNFQGDTTIHDDGATINISRHGDKMEVKVVMSDSLKVEERAVEVH